jgi:hypothetical protein
VVATPDDALVEIVPDGEAIVLETDLGQDGVVTFDAPADANGYVLEWVSHYPHGGTIYAPDGSSADFREPEEWQELDFSIPEPGTNSILIDPGDELPGMIESLLVKAFGLPRARSGGSMTLRLKSVPKYRIELRTFIPGDHVTSGGMKCRPNWHSLEQRMYFEGDNRHFMRNPSTYRTQQLITVVANSRGDADGYLGRSYRASVGRTRIYASNALKNQVIDHRDRDGRLNDCHLLHQEKALCISCNDHFDVSYSRRSSRAVRVHLSGEAKNPLTRFGCGISYRATLDIGESSGGRRPWYVLGIDHDGFPAYEIYVNDQPIYTYKPSGWSPYSFSQVLTLCGDKEKSATRSGSLP